VNFPLTKNGTTYSFEEAGFLRRDAAGRDLFVPFGENTKIRYSFFGQLSLKGPYGRASLADLSQEEQGAILLEFLRRWKSQSPDSAKKAAFDYLDGQKGFVALAFGVSLLFALPLAAGLLADSRNQFSCTKVLQESSVVGQMDVTKFKRKRKGHYILDLAFTAPDGTKILGRDQLIVADEAQIPKSVPVVYSPDQPGCWSLTTNLTGSDVNWAKRRFFGYFTAMFGTFFLLSGLYGIAWAGSRWLKPRPFKKEIAQIFAL